MYSCFQSSVIFCFSLLFICSSCQKDPEPPEPEVPAYNADEQLWIYFERFEREAQRHGITADLNSFGVSGRIADIPERGVAGVCQYGYRRGKDITLDQNYWNKSGDLGREFVVFHELGHCFLFRDHTEDSFPNGLCVSIMRSGLGNCNDAYNFQNRAYYIDELFSTSGN